ncbi:RHS repeat domain-containing protein, partial [Patescibacteria group bacterium]
AHDAAVGDSADTSQTYDIVQASLAGNYYIKRCFMPIDTSALPDDATIASSTLYGYWQVDLGGPHDGNGGLVLVETSQASTSTLVVADFDNVAFVSGGTHAYPSPPEWVDLEFNETALGWINKTGYTKVGILMNKDFDDSVPAGLYQGSYRSSRYTGTDYDPYIEIEYSVYEPSESALQNLTYTYDAVGNINKIEDTSLTNSAKTTEYTYDDLYRLTIASTTDAVSGGDYIRTYDYNAIGNILNKSDQGAYTYAGNQGVSYANPHAVTSLAGSSYSYDLNGNLTSNSVWDYYWTYNNRIASSTSGTATSTYAYDHSGIRVSLFDGTATTTYPNKYYNIAGATTTRHIFLGDQIIATVEGNGTATSTYYIHTDHLSGSNVITDSSGNLEQLIDYYPFGDMRLNEKDGEFDEQRKFTGHEHDDDTGLEYMLARYQNPAVGRFLSVDPVHRDIGLSNDKFKEKYGKEFIPDMTDHKVYESKALLLNPQSLNGYSYSINNPIIYFDPNGETWKIKFSGTALGWSGSIGVSFSISGLNVNVAGGIGVGIEGGFTASYLFGDNLSHRTEVTDTAGGDAAFGVGYGYKATGEFVSETCSLKNKSSEHSVVFGVGAAVYARKEISVPILGRQPSYEVTVSDSSVYTTPETILPEITIPTNTVTIQANN